MFEGLTKSPHHPVTASRIVGNQVCFSWNNVVLLHSSIGFLFSTRPWLFSPSNILFTELAFWLCTSKMLLRKEEKWCSFLSGWLCFEQRWGTFLEKLRAGEIFGFWPLVWSKQQDFCPIYGTVNQACVKIWDPNSHRWTITCLCCNCVTTCRYLVILRMFIIQWSRRLTGKLQGCEWRLSRQNSPDKRICSC